MGHGGAFLRLGQTGLRIIEFACAAIIFGIYSYFLAVLARHNITIPTWELAVEGMSGAACLYTIFGILFTLCLGGVFFFALIAVVLDICFVGCFAAIAYYTRHGANSCRGMVNTPLGTGLDNQAAPGAGNWAFVCRLNTSCFAVAVVNIFLFLLTAVVQVLLARHHKKEKRFGPGPTNNYTKGFGRRPFWKRNRRVQPTRDAEMAIGTGPTSTYRPSHETGVTGSTMNNAGHSPLSSEPKYGQPGYGMQGYAAPATNY
ncbi:uncharacterized protein Z518_10967 [Rhinocladiella mackenziei CBS 650.93]|uniref:MARVEL domain-containing protein n=1 Tax=Rhinocladiella mackenziei CBS 650.93 TaxID=1442369 RepID=A0A0D2ITK5_9EURO|nr:uncharacterized protein Z518_10967 [Rhinocladiella mackenziei CBS 650.93]KIX00040.1 hypothetical protein Z518_10967 [Rhinocladiella mackenziei CBS 650.93]